ncbi:MAG: glycosyltransferase family 2 protein [Candidatus Marinimicrobia bacterium]|nr:glycosyltransferase family 2 protein [Candidatus Neomarinimicrobiota bacterium]
MTPKISIIVLNWNNWPDTIACVESIEKNVYENYNIIIVDNNSEDSSEKILRQKYPDKIFIQSGDNLGYAGGNNIGIEKALSLKSDYILLLNNDTIVRHDFLQPLVNSFSLDEKIGIVSGKILYLDEQPKIWYAGGKIDWLRGSGFSYGNKQIDNGQFDYNREVSFVSGCMMLIKREVIENIKLLNEDYFLYLEDTEYCFRAIKAGYKLYYVHQSLIYHKVNEKEGRYASTIYYSTRNRLKFIRENAQFIYRALFPFFILIVFTMKIIVWIISGKWLFINAFFRALKDAIIGKYGHSE